MRILGLDYGDKRIGVAISDAFGWSAHALETISRTNPIDHKSSIARIAQIAASNDVSIIALGYPKNMDNTEGIRCEKTLIFKRQMAHVMRDVQIILVDERLSSQSASRMINDLGLSQKKRESYRKEHIDKTAAVFILQNYLDTVANTKREEDKIMSNDDFKDVNIDEIDLDDETEINCVVMTDEDGNDVEYVIIDEIEHNGNRYLVMIEADDDDDDEAEAVIYKHAGEENDEVIYEEIDEKEFESLLEILKERLSDFDVEF